jgi:hypothetical protein
MRRLLALLVAVAACGGSTAASVVGDAGTGSDGAPWADSTTADVASPDAGADAGAAADAGDVANADATDDGSTPCNDGGCAPPDAGVDAPPFVDAGCIEGGLPPAMGTAFTCGLDTCFSQSQYCMWGVGGIVPEMRNGVTPRRGAQLFAEGTCMPLPCSCGAFPTCACIQALPLVAPCQCMEAEGGIGVECFFP